MYSVILVVEADETLGSGAGSISGPAASYQTTLSAHAETLDPMQAEARGLPLYLLKS